MHVIYVICLLLILLVITVYALLLILKVVFGIHPSFFLLQRLLRFVS